MNIELDAQSIVYKRLKSNASLMSLVTGIFDGVPNEQPKPYVSLGEQVSTNYDDSCTIRDSISLTIHTISDKKGSNEVKIIQGMIKDSLHYYEQVTNDNYAFGIVQDQATSFLEPDGVTRHGINIIRILISER